MIFKAVKGKGAGQFFAMIKTVSIEAQYFLTIKDHKEVYTHDTHIGTLCVPLEVLRADVFCRIHGEWPNYFIEAVKRD